MTYRNERIANSIHRAFALFFIAMMAIGFYMTRLPFPQTSDEIHSSLGIVFLILIQLRLLSKYRTTVPTGLLHAGNTAQEMGFRKALLALMIIIPFSGLISQALSGRGVNFFDWQMVAINGASTNSITPFHDLAYTLAQTCHTLTCYAAVVLLVWRLTTNARRLFNTKKHWLKRVFEAHVSL